jgi:DNA topoisomerase II|uniref:DNA topoisomerase (ATP-hydrolyzing) n=1 Tax=viral metagenome TaxID=1070528 RepID=A0A6C0IMN0_9ZZZZ
MQNTQSDENLANVYQQKTDKQHILDNPDTYIGSVENVDAQMWIYDNETQKIALKNIEYIPGLYKLFDEGIVNCRDHVIRMIQSTNIHKKFVSYIDTQIDEDGTITMSNDGNGIDIAKHPTYDVWIPELVFGHLRTSTNYNKNEKRIVGGKNGFGFKLVLIWSSYGKIETVDHTRGLKYVQEFHNNLDTMGEPVITKVSAGTKPYTKVTFKPDYSRFGIDGITGDMFNLLKKRVVDIAAVTDHSIKKVKMSFNSEVIPVKTFQNYVDMYIGEKGDTKRIYEKTDERWEYGIALSPIHEFVHISFVNGICTFKGGKHVDYISNQIVKKLCDYIEKKKKIKVNASSIKEQIMLFLRCDIENPSFDSQTKDYMNTPSSKFGSSCTVSDGFIERIAKMGVMDVACSLTEAKENKLIKKTDGIKTKTIRGIHSFIDANFAGTTQSKDCILILCEGLSALSGIVSGLSSDDRNTIGIYPLKGKLLNVRGEQLKKIAENKEINDIKKIMGLESGKFYDTIEQVHQHLRYGKIMYMTDQDLDGSHIKGLCINMFHSEWDSLTKIPGFISFMNTPILRAKKGNKTELFYNDGEYNNWKNTFGEQGSSGWNIKYFKGLGTSTSAEFKEYFANKKIVNFVHTTNSDNMIDKIFNKKRTDDRKEWLGNYNKESYLNTNNENVTYEDFINQELIHFSTYDCARSIPNMVDGLKISLRKILYSAFKRKLTSEIKVAQFSGYVSEHSAYHHGEASLNGAIVNMAQNFVGSNNVNLLAPNGQFGTRLQGGDDSASERYIFTQLNPLTRCIFPEQDDPVLHYLNDDGTIVEPEYYVPVIPFTLLNGISGIGTGFSCNMLAYNPTDIVNALKLLLNNKPINSCTFTPYYEGFTGTVSLMETNKYLIKGKYEKIDTDKIRITELPIGTWTMPYITFLESLVDGSTKNGKRIASTLRDFTSLSTEVTVDITVVFPRGKLEDYENQIDDNGINGVEKLLKLTTTQSSTNMHMFTHEHKLRKFVSVHEIIQEFYPVRLNMYKRRKAYLLANMEKLLQKLSNKSKYILLNLDSKIDLRKKTSAQVEELLLKHELDKLEGDFKYLTKMPMDSVTQEHVDNLINEKEKMEKDYETLKGTSLEKMWKKELDGFEKEYTKYKEKREKLQISTDKSSKVKTKKIVRKKK